MSEMTLFIYQGRDLRTVMIEGEPWVVAADACAMLGIGNSRQAVTRLDSEDVSSTDIIDSMGRRQKVNIVNESGLYALMFASRTQEAKDVKRWVTSEVLPSIRRTGQYGGKVYRHPEEMMIEQAQNMLATRLETERLAREQTALSIRQAVSEAKIAGLEGSYDCFSALAYARLNGLSTDATYLSRVGKKASSLCAHQGVVPGSRQDARYGKVGTYPVSILSQAFQEVPR